MTNDETRMTRYQALACDYDGTLARDGIVERDVAGALQRCRDSGRRLLLVTGRELQDLQAIFERLALFDYVIAENGALLYRPATGEERLLAAPPPDAFIQALRTRGVDPLALGHAIVATRSPFETVVLQTIRDLGLELQVVFNKGSVMVLPSGVNKATGLAEALRRLCIPPQNAVAVGDAENDHALLDAVGLGVAVASAVPMLLERADFVTTGGEGEGVVELIDRLLENDLAEINPRKRSAPG
jgi:hydroxymethylpyrimidine pyrophosphatase-like HAD family hydrolase